MLGEEAPARAALQKAANASPGFPEKEEAQRRLAVMSVDIQTPNPNLRSQIENYLRESPNDPLALFRLAELQERGGEVDQALKVYEKIVEENPEFAPAARRFAVLYGQSWLMTRRLTK